MAPPKAGDMWLDVVDEDMVLDVVSSKILCFDCGRINPPYKDLFPEANEDIPLPDEYVALFECDGCGTAFNRKNTVEGTLECCPECHKPGRKIADRSCVFCNGEVHDIYLFECRLCFASVPEALLEEHRKSHVINQSSCPNIPFDYSTRMTLW